MRLNRMRLLISITAMCVIFVVPNHAHAQKARSRRDQVVIQVIQIDYADAEHLATVLAPLLSPTGRIAAYARINRLIIKDKASVVKRLVKIIKGPPEQQP